MKKADADRMQQVRTALAIEVPAARGALDMFTREVAKLQGGAWKKLLKRGVIAAALVAAVYALYRWRQRHRRLEQDVINLRPSIERGEQRVAGASEKERARIDEIKGAGSKRECFEKTWEQLGPAAVRRMRAEGDELKALTNQPAEITFNPTELLQSIEELGVAAWKQSRADASGKPLDEGGFGVGNSDLVVLSDALNKKLTQKFGEKYPSGKWKFKAIDYGASGGKKIVDPTIVGYNSEYGVVKIANPYFDPRGGRPQWIKTSPRLIPFPPQFRNLMRRATNKKRIRHYGTSMHATAPRAYVVPLAGYDPDKMPIADGNHAVVVEFVKTTGEDDSVVSSKNMRGEFLMTNVIGSDDLHQLNIIEVGDKGCDTMCIETEKTTALRPDSWRKFRGRYWRSGVKTLMDYLQRERLVDSLCTDVTHRLDLSYDGRSRDLRPLLRVRLLNTEQFKRFHGSCARNKSCARREAVACFFYQEMILNLLLTNCAKTVDSKNSLYGDFPHTR